MQIITREDVAEVVRDLVDERGSTYRDHTHALYDYTGGVGLCFVGALMEKLHITPRRIAEGKLKVRRVGKMVLDFDWSPAMPSIASIEFYQFQDTEREVTFGFEPGVGRLLNESMNRNDAGEPWGVIAKNKWGVMKQSPTDCPCPLCDPEAREEVYHDLYKPKPKPHYDPIHKFTGLENVPVKAVTSLEVMAKQLVSAI